MGLRCFISIELPEELKKIIYMHIERLKATGADVKWVPQENLHLTLKFLGSTREELLKDINERLTALAEMHDRFSIHLSGSGVFPNMKHPRVIWFGMHDSDEVIKLQHEIDESMAELGFERDDKKFTPHLTIGRVRSPKNKDALMREIATLKEVDFGKIDVNNITLMRSELKPHGAEHFKINEVPIGKRR